MSGKKFSTKIENHVKECWNCKDFNNFRNGLCDPSSKCTFKPADRKQLVSRFKDLIELIEEYIFTQDEALHKSKSKLKPYKRRKGESTSG